MRRELLARAVMTALALRTSMPSADPLPTEIALARRLFADAKVAEEAKDWPTAASRLRDAILIKETSGLRFHLAYCEEQQGLLVEALVDYERADDLSVDRNDDFRTQLPARRASLRKRIPTVTLVPTHDAASDRLTIDGHPLSSASLGKPIPLNPGRHAFVVSSPGSVPFSTELSLKEGDAVVTNVVLAPQPSRNSVSVLPLPEAPPKVRVPQATGAPTGASRAQVYVLVGEGAIVLGGLAVGITFTLRAASEDERASRDRANLGSTPGEVSVGCTSQPQNVATCADIAAAVHDAGRDHVVALVGFIGAGVGAAAFAGTLILWPSARPQTAIRPWLAPDVTGLSVAGRF
jgi:hypothetical protein